MTKQTYKIKTLLNQDWETALAELSTQDAMDKSESIIKEAVEKCVPSLTTLDSNQNG